MGAQISSQGKSTSFEKIKGVLFIAVIVLCTLFSSFEAQRRVTRCGFVNQCFMRTVVAGHRCVRSVNQCVQHQPIFANVCARYASRCLAYHHRRVTRCLGYANRCVQNQTYCARNASYCVRQQPVVQFYCAQHGTRCAQNQVIRKQICVKHQAQKQCIGWRNVTTKFCKQIKHQCGAFTNVSVSVCNRMGKKCTRASHRRVCTKHARYCAKFLKSSVRYCKRSTATGRCLSFKKVSRRVCGRYANQCVKYTSSSSKVCKKSQPHCVRRAKAVRVCATWSFRLVNRGKVCQRWNAAKVIKKGTCLRFSTKRVCVDSRVCTKNFFVGNKIVRTQKSKPQCLKYKSVRRCVSKATKRIVVARTCASWKVRQAKVKYCAKYTTRPGRCLKSVRRCISYATIVKRRCAKTARRCVAFRTVSSRVCTKKAPVCVAWGIKHTSRCARFANKCVAYKTVSQCHAYANVCTARGIKIHRRCVRLDKVCAVHGSRTHRVCNRYRNTSRCVQYRTLVQNRCVRHQQYCVRQARRVTGHRCVQTGTRCVQHATRCIRHQRYCARPQTYTIKTTCARAQNYCAGYRRVQRGSRCVRTAARCVQNAPIVRHVRQCARRRVCRVVIVRGDPHILTEEGKDENSQYTGVFTYYRFKNLWIQVRFSRRHHGSVVSGVALLRRRRRFGWGLKYRAVVTKNRKLRVFARRNRNVKVVKRGEEYVVGTKFGNLLVFFDKVTASISIEFKPKHGDGRGLVHNNKHFRKFRVRRRASRLGKRIRFTKFTPKPHKRFAGLAKSECEGTKYGVKLSDRAVKDCKFDVMITGEKFGRLYAKFQKDVAKGDINKA